MILPSGMDGVGGLSQPHIPSGKTFVYEFDLVKSGTFMYHPHSDEMVQMAMGMMGFFVIHPRDPKFMPVDRDFVFLLSAYDIDPGTYVPRIMEMTDFNLWTFNTRVFPGIDPLVVSKNDRVRVRVGNLTMTNHPIHMHGYDFEVTCTDGGWVRPEARWPEVSIDIPVGAMRAYEFDAKYVGDWAIHCHKSHHTMNAMGHEIPTFIGVDKKEVAKKIRQIRPEYMPMGTAGMADMGEMSMEIPENTVPMMTGWGPHGPIEMGGMFSVVKVREGISAGDYSDPGWYENPPGTQAWEWTGSLPEPGGHGEMAVGEPGEKAKASQTIRVTMKETDDGKMIFTPSTFKVRQGQTVRFAIKNAGEVDHEFVLDQEDKIMEHKAVMEKFPEMEHEDPNAIRLAPGKSGEIVWKFTNDGVFKIACLVPGHYDSGMHGDVTVAKK
eukprot:g15432.t1